MSELVKYNTTDVERWSPDQINEQIQLIQQVMKSNMIEGEHYGTIPGCGDKKVLFKSGSEKLGLIFRLSVKLEGEREPIGLGKEHREYVIKCTLTHITTGQFWGHGVGSCSTMESKYRYREATRKCPQCGKEAIIKGKEEYGGGWVCFKKKDGCGAKFPDDDTTITSQKVGRIENEDIADQYNTVLKMAAKRAKVDGIITATGASDLFTQDWEENAEFSVVDTQLAEKKPANGSTTKPPKPTNGDGELNPGILKMRAMALKQAGVIKPDEFETFKKRIDAAKETDLDSISKELSILATTQEVLC